MNPCDLGAAAASLVLLPLSYDYQVFVRISNANTRRISSFLEEKLKVLGRNCGGVRPTSELDYL